MSTSSDEKMVMPWKQVATLFRGVLTGPGQDIQSIRRHAAVVLQRVGLTAGRCLGSGGYGAVLEATARNGDRVAVKVSRSSRAWSDYSFLEPCTLRMCNHPNIIRVHDVMEDICSYTMELCDGALSDLIKARTEWVEMDQVRSWLGQCAGAVAYLHLKGIIHGDIKSENILHVGGGATLKLCDLGMLRFEGCREDEGALCTFIQTPPEAILGSGCTTKAMDVWALGLVGLHMVELWRSVQPLGNTHFELFIVQCMRFGTPTPETWPGLQLLENWNDSYPRFKAPPAALRVKFSDAIKADPPKPLPHVTTFLAAALKMCPERRATAAALFSIIAAAPRAPKRAREHA